MCDFINVIVLLDDLNSFLLLISHNLRLKCFPNIAQ